MFSFIHRPRLHQPMARTSPVRARADPTSEHTPTRHTHRGPSCGVAQSAQTDRNENSKQRLPGGFRSTNLETNWGTGTQDR